MKRWSAVGLLLWFVFLAGCATIQSGGELQYGRQALIEGRTKPLSAIFRVPLRGIPISYTGLGAHRRKVFGVMSDAQSILPANFQKPAETWNGRLPPISLKISPDYI